SAIDRASSTSIPRYLTVLSILVWPSRSCTAQVPGGPHPQGGETCRLARGAGDQIRACHQRRDRADTRPHCATVAPCYSRRGDRINTAILLHCICRLVAQSDVSLRRECLAAIEGEADIARTPPSCRCEANDPSATSSRNFCCDAQRCPLVGFVLDGQFCMRRRNFIALLCSAAVAWPLAARAQQGERMRRIGVLEPLAVDDPEALARVTAFAQGLQQLGWTAGRNVRIDYRWGAGDPDR